MNAARTLISYSDPARMPANSYVYYFARIVPEYRVPVLAELNDRLGDRLVVCSGTPPSGSSLEVISAAPGSRIRTVSLKNSWFAGESGHFQNFLPAFREFGMPSAILAEESPRSISLPLMMIWAKRHDVPIGLWGHFSSNARDDSNETWRDRYRWFLAGRADACVCYTSAIADRLVRSAPRDRIFVATNTLDTPTLFMLHDQLSKEGRLDVRQRLGLPEEMPLLAYIGRLTEDKQVDTLIDVTAALQRKRDVGLVIVGDGPTRAVLEERARQQQLRHTFFLGAMHSLEESAPFLFASDVLVLPGPVGLAVNHALSLGLPVIARRAHAGMRFHSPEIDFIQHDVNGLVVDRDASHALQQGVEHILEHRESFSNAAVAYARQHLTLERMVDGLEAAVEAMEGTSDSRQNR